ncbi:MAG: SprT-like domain-containing protein [Lachnospiraceae bacterium]|nr:SprT-like domain-containing protein [Lachnospiraceae bacterium]
MLKNMQEVLEYGFDVLNEVYFDNALPPAIVTIMSSPKSYGHFTCGKIWKAEESRYNEINISAEYLNRNIENIMATLMHEMIHFYCQLENIKDTSNLGRYHNKNFKREAEARGLIISYADNIGYSVTSPSEAFIEVIKSHWRLTGTVL